VAGSAAPALPAPLAPAPEPAEEPGRPLRLLLADDHPAMLRGIAEHLRRAGGFEIVAEVSSGEEAVERARELRPDVVLMDLLMPGIGGIEAIRRIHALDPGIRALALTGESESETLMEVLEAGGSGFVRKSTAHEDLVPALRTVARDEVFLYPSGQKFLLRAYHSRPERNAKLLEPLSEHEREILALAAEGYNSTEIGKRLFLSPKTVDTYRAQAMRRVGLTHRTELVRFALRTGLLGDAGRAGPRAAARP
jgi:two-component system response regulator NreC